MVIPAAGRGVRLGPGAPKALRELGGAPMLVHAVRATARARSVTLVVVVAPSDGVRGVRTLLDEALLEERGLPDIVVVPGGETRQDSVRLGLEALPDTIDTVLVHDAARPLVPADTVEAVAAAVRAGAPAVVPALPRDRHGQGGRAARRRRPRAGHRHPRPLPAARRPDPPGLHPRGLAEAHARIAAEGEGATDDAGMVERLGVDVVVVPGHEEAFKVTRPLDLVLAEAVLARRRARDEY